MRRQISVIKGCKVDLQLGSEYRTLGNASANSVARCPFHRTSYQFIRNEWKSRLRWLQLAITSCGCGSHQHRNVADSIECSCIVYDLRGDGNTAIKLQQWKCRMRLKDDATMRDHCHEYNNGILRTMVATIDNHKAVQPLTRAIRLPTDRGQIYKNGNMHFFMQTLIFPETMIIAF